ncbi:MAG: hypothetical protein HY900_01965 [Deltaproteobacteria bacterium]|nr:hypothetical protein [Deltaproteobacteria bacterium]
MDTKITIALVSACAALVVSIINLIAGIVLAKRSYANSASLERYKVVLNVATEELCHTMEALAEGVRCIQNVKDVIWTIVQSVPSSLDTADINGALIKAAMEIETAFGKNDAYLTPEQRKPFHAAKNLSLTVKETVRALQDVTMMTDETRRTLLDLRRDLSDAQAQLRDSKLDTLLRLEGIQ